MTVEASEFLTLARAMLKSDSEINWRSCVSRAYYATFHAALPFAGRLGAPKYFDDGAGCHERLIRRFDDKDNPLAIQRIARELRNLKKMRVDADYRLGRTCTREEAMIAVDTAQHVCACIDKASGIERRTRRVAKRRRRSKAARG
jgi:hypothetical protein